MGSGIGSGGRPRGAFLRGMALLFRRSNMGIIRWRITMASPENEQPAKIPLPDNTEERLGCVDIQECESRGHSHSYEIS